MAFLFALKVNSLKDWRFCLYLLFFIAALSLGLLLYKLPNSTFKSHLSARKSKPHIILIVADDYGWNDIGYHGSEIATPNLDQLAADGIKLENYYVQPICTPTRSQLLSGRYQIHTGLQHGVVRPCQASGLPTDIPTIADELRALGYSTHAIGKWHLGFHQTDYTPLRRGFVTHFGMLLGSGDHYNHTREDQGLQGVDFWENGKPTDSYRGQYSTQLFTDRAEKLIEDHDGDQALFVYLAYQAVHGPLQAPKKYYNQYLHIKNENRRIHAAMTSAMDDGIGRITKALKRNNIWEDTLIIFTTDNGGVAHSGGNNFPLRGEKSSHFEGGIRAVGFLSGGFIQKRGETNHRLIHVTDWYPTLINLAGGNASNVTGLDGFDQWPSLTQNEESKRKEFLINIDPLTVQNVKSGSPIFDTSIKSGLRYGDWKLLTGKTGKDGWHRSPHYKSTLSPTSNETVFSGLWEKLKDNDPMKSIYLFNISQDPQERHEISDRHPKIVQFLLTKLSKYQKTAVPVNFPESDPKLRCNPDKHGGFWVPWDT